MKFAVRKRIGLPLLACGFAAALYAADSVRYMNLWQDVTAVAPGRCEPLHGLRGAEDIVVTRQGLAIASLNNRDPHDNANVAGSLVALSLDGGPHKTLWDGGGRAFHPHGIDYLEAADGREYLFAINHAPGGDTVMIFRFASASLELIKEIESGRTTLNDIAAVDADRFYFTVDHATDSRLLNRVSDYLRLPTGYVDYFDGGKFERAIADIPFANGIALSPDKRRLYVAAMLGARIQVYARAGQGWVKEEDLPVPGNPDNLSLAPDGALLAAVHPKILDLAKQNRERSFRAPSVIVRIDRRAQAAQKITTLFSDPGDLLSSASIAVETREGLLVGSVFDDRMLRCTTPSAVLSMNRFTR